jgi:hypothetical protein
MQTRPKATSQQQKEYEMSTLNDTVSKLNQMQQMFGRTAADVAGLVGNAMDTDAGLSLSGVSQLGGDATDVATLAAARAQGLTEPALVQAILTGVPPVLVQPPQPAAPVPPTPPPAPVTPPAAPEVDLSQFMGAPPAAPTQAASAPPPARGKKGKQTPAGALPPRFFEILKDNTGIKSEDLGASIGVSRQTFDNYTKGKAHCTPTLEHMTYLRTMIDSKIKLLQEAAALLPAAQQ